MQISNAFSFVTLKSWSSNLAFAFILFFLQELSAFLSSAQKHLVITEKYAEKRLKMGSLMGNYAHF